MHEAFLYQTIHPTSKPYVFGYVCLANYTNLSTKKVWIVFVACLLLFSHPSLLYGQSSEKLPSLFPYGVASGDPTADRVILWTKIAGKPTQEAIRVTWLVAKDADMKTVVKSGVMLAQVTSDFTVKVDVTGLEPATRYYYRFLVENHPSVTGTTKTAPMGDVSALNFAVVSCSNYAEGYFGALANIADRTNLDAVIHLGDYIYESTERDFETRSNEALANLAAQASKPSTKAGWLTYYRVRYALTRLDSTMRRAHQVLPFISVWDDHETADNAYANGASGHHVREDGSWEDRKAAAKQAYFEWMPIRGDKASIYRSLKFGNLLELILLDTRLEGRDQQIYEASSPQLLSPGRTLLGQKQLSWLLNKLKTSSARWKVIGNQVIFSPINVGWAKVGPFSSQVEELENNLLDYWQGYPNERDSIIHFLHQEAISNVVWLSASMHCSLAFDIVLKPDRTVGEQADSSTQKGSQSVAVEFATPSISSANFDEKIGSLFTNAFESKLNQMLPPPFGFNPNPHLKFVDLDEHGYFILELSKQKAQASWYFISNKYDPHPEEKLIEAWYTQDKGNRLEPTQP
jgi:alkaline phosphatase D